MRLDVDTHLGSFGPGADPPRSRAANPPPRLAVNLLNLKFDVRLSKFPSANLAPKFELKWATNLENQGQGGVPHRTLGPKIDQIATDWTWDWTWDWTSWAEKGGQHGSNFSSEMKPIWPQLGSQVAAKMAQKSMQKCIICLMALGIDFWMDFGGFWLPKSNQVGTK